jgi:hypothetical protein
MITLEYKRNLGLERFSPPIPRLDVIALILLDNRDIASSERPDFLVLI